MQHYHRVISMLLLNGTSIIQTYFVISGFMLTIQFMLYKENSKELKWSCVPEGVLYRFLRLTPVYFLMILLNATILIRLQNGPLWNRIGEIERTFCRNNWWTNLVYVNNYYKISEPVNNITILNITSLWLKIAYIYFLVFTACVVFSCRFSFVHNWINFINDYVEIYQREAYTNFINCYCLLNTSCCHIFIWLWRCCYFHTSVSIVITFTLDEAIEINYQLYAVNIVKHIPI